MGKLLYTINTVNNFMDMIFNPFARPFLEKHPEIETFNIMDDSLLVGTRKYGRMTPEIASRVLNYAKAAEQSGADGIIVTCTSVNEATLSIRPFLTIPMMGIEEPVAEQAVLNGKRIGVIGTIPTSPVAIDRTIRRKADEHGRSIEIRDYVVEGAFDILQSGDRARHDEMVRDALRKVEKEVDVIAFAQISMSKLVHDPVSVPIFKIGTSGFEEICRLMAGNDGEG